jgi:hypothetical protein
MADLHLVLMTNYYGTRRCVMAEMFMCALVHHYKVKVRLAASISPGYQTLKIPEIRRRRQVNLRHVRAIYAEEFVNGRADPCKPATQKAKQISLIPPAGKVDSRND